MRLYETVKRDYEKQKRICQQEQQKLELLEKELGEIVDSMDFS